MKKFGIYPKITKKYILDRISQEDIMDYFLGIPVNYDTQKSNSISSPYRTDNNPSCNYYYNDNGKLRFVDKTTGDNYDCFDVLAKSLNVSSSNKLGFILTLNEIAKVFRLNKYENYEEVIKYEKIKKEKYTKQKTVKKKRIIQYKLVLRKFNYHDKSYFGKAGLEEKDLKGVYLIQKIFVSYDYQRYRLYYTYSPYDPCYGYYGGIDKDRHIQLWKFYFPLRTKKDKRGTRFKTNGSFMQGIQYLIPDKFCIVTKSFKDVKVFNKIGFQSVSLAAETTEPTEDEVWFLKTMFPFILVCLDFDYTGVTMTNSLRKKYNFIPYMFTNGRFNTFDYKAKDAFEYASNNSLKDLKEIVKIEYLKNKEDIGNFLSSLYSNLKFIK